MKLIIDSNIIISALIKDSKTREIILKSGFEFLHPERALKNIDKYKEEIIEKSGLNLSEYEKLLESLIESILLIDSDKFLYKLDEAKKIMINDIEDVPFVALALSVENDGIWSEDKHFEKQDKIRIWKTREIVDIIGKL